MKHKRLNRDGWGFQGFPYYQVRIDTDDFHGTACVIKLLDGEYQYWETPKSGELAVCGRGMTWMQLVPDYAKHVITVKYFPDNEPGIERKHYPEFVNTQYPVSVWYVDITDGIEIAEDGTIIYIDKYLDVIFTPEGDVVVDDRDELDAALESGELTKESYEAAIAEGDKVLRELSKDIPTTEAWCARIRKAVEEKITANPELQISGARV